MKSNICIPTVLVNTREICTLKWVQWHEKIVSVHACMCGHVARVSSSTSENLTHQLVY